MKLMLTVYGPLAGRQDLTLKPKQEEGAIFHLSPRWSGRLRSERSVALAIARHLCGTYSYSVYFVDKLTVQFTVKYTNNVAHAHYHPCNEYQAVFSPFSIIREKNKTAWGRGYAI